MNRTSLTATLTAGLAAGALLASPAPVAACGGFFCSSTPVDQNAERILFVQEDAETVTAIVEIQFEGEPEDFAWIVPVPARPDLAIWHGQAFSALDQATQPIFNPPWQCFPVPAAEDAGGVDPDRGEVNVLERGQVGDYDFVTIESRDPRALIEWLRTNEYRITPEMEPFVAIYTAEGMKFTAVKLQAGKGLDSIKPLKMTYRSAHPMVPLRLTSVAAQLEMGVKVWILADQRYGPGEGVADLEIDDAEIVFDPSTMQTNYLALVARKVDAAGGRGFVTEYAQPTADLARRIAESPIPPQAGEDAEKARDALVELLQSKPYITRLYTRLSPEEMDFDPIFVPVDGDDVSNVHDIPPPEDDEACGFQAEVDPCEFVACGAGGRCFVATDEETGQQQVGCACAEGALARPRADATAPGGVGVGCGDARLNFTAPEILANVSSTATMAFADPCVGDPCGENGECVSLNGFQSCRCAHGFVAVGRLDEEGRPYATCVAPDESVPDDFYDLELPEPDLPFPGRPARSPGAASPGEGGCAVGASAPAGGLLLLALAFAPLARRRRR